MNSANGQTPARRSVQGFLGRVADALAECQYAQNRLFVLRTAVDRHVPNPNAAPETYAEFLFRTSGALLHEPSAQARAQRHGSLRP